MMNLTTLTREQKLELLGAGALILVLLGLIGWYMATNRAPEPYVPVPETVPTVPPPPEPGMIIEHAQYYEIEATYPAETPLLSSADAEANAAAIGVMKTFVEDTVQDFKRQGDFDSLTDEDLRIMGYDQGRKQTLAIEYEEKAGADTVSYVYTIYIDTFGAHPNGFYRTFTFDTESGTELAIRNLFQPKSAYLARLSEISRFELAKVLGPDANLEYLNQGTEPKDLNFENFAIESDALVLIFPPYQVGPYALGTQIVTIPLSQLKDILKPEYLP